MLSRKKRDAKFLIFQSLYIIAISILFYKGTDLSLVAVKDATDSTNTYLSATETKIDTSLLNELSRNNAFVDKQKDTLVDRNLLAQITNKANENSKVPIIPRPNIPLPNPPKESEKEPEKKQEKEKKDPKPLPTDNVTEYSTQSFPNPSNEKKLLVYQNGSLIGVIDPGKTKKLRIKGTGNITYGYSD